MDNINHLKFVIVFRLLIGILKLYHVITNVKISLEQYWILWMMPDVIVFLKNIIGPLNCLHA